MILSVISAEHSMGSTNKQAEVIWEFGKAVGYKNQYTKMSISNTGKRQLQFEIETTLPFTIPLKIWKTWRYI